MSYNWSKISYSGDIQRQDDCLALNYPLCQRGHRVSRPQPVWECTLPE